METMIKNGNVADSDFMGSISRLGWAPEVRESHAENIRLAQLRPERRKRQSEVAKEIWAKRNAKLLVAERILNQRTPEEVTDAARITLAACLRLKLISKRGMRNSLFPKQNVLERRYPDTKQFFRRKLEQIEAETLRLTALPGPDREAAEIAARIYLEGGVQR